MDGSIAGYHWDFGDGQSADGVQVTHTYNTPGGYAVTLTADDGTSVSNSKSIITKTLMINDPPASNAGPDQIVGPGEVVTFDASRSTDPDGNIIKYSWDFGDKTNETGAKVSHTYTQPGTYTVRLRVRDSSGIPAGEAWDELVVTVKKR